MSRSESWFEAVRSELLSNGLPHLFGLTRADLEKKLDRAAHDDSSTPGEETFEAYAERMVGMILAPDPVCA